MVYRLNATDIFVIFLSQDGFESNCAETKFQTIISLNQFEKVTIPEVHCRTLDSYSQSSD